MKTRKRGLIGGFIFLVICNIFSSYFKFFIEGNLYDHRYYVTKDKRFPSEASYDWIQKNPDSQTYYYYTAYRKAYPDADTTLYRTKPILLYRFWRWGEYIFYPYWQQPYIEMPYKEWDGILKQMWAKDSKYGVPFPKDTVNVSKK